MKSFEQRLLEFRDAAIKFGTKPYTENWDALMALQEEILDLEAGEPVAKMVIDPAVGVEYHTAPEAEAILGPGEYPLYLHP